MNNTKINCTCEECIFGIIKPIKHLGIDGVFCNNPTSNNYCEVMFKSANYTCNIPKVKPNK